MKEEAERFISQNLIKLKALADDPHDYLQWGLIAGAFFLSWILARILRKTLFCQGSKCVRICSRFFKPKREIGVFPLTLAGILWGASHCLPQSAPYVETAAMLATAYALYRIAASLAKSPWAPRLIGGILLLSFILNLFGALGPTIQALQNMRLPLGNVPVSLWAILSGVSALFFLLWIASLATTFVDVAVSQQKEIPPSIRVLIGKLARVIFYAAGILMALKIGGIDLGMLTVFTGALGLGIGFGLQKVISNLISGIIILLDKSVKPGDVIEVEGTYGWINSLRSRYVSVITRDRKEHLIPNEDFITNPVVNWSFTERAVRIRANVGVAYDTDLELALKLCIEAAEGVERVLTKPAVNCLLMGFGDSSVDLQIRFWINDANQGVSNVRSQVLLEVWKKFKEHGIEIPFPQQDLHLRSSQLEKALLTPPDTTQH